MDEIDQYVDNVELTIAMHYISPVYREIIIMRNGWDGGKHTFPEIGKALCISKDQARDWYYKGIEQLKEIIEKRSQEV